jgi:hypothetical protein
VLPAIDEAKLYEGRVKDGGGRYRCIAKDVLKQKFQNG